MPRVSNQAKPKPPADLIRPYWRELHVRDWTLAELETANLECTSLSHKYGFDSGDKRFDRSQYAAAALAGQHPPYDVVTGREGHIKNWDMRAHRKRESDFVPEDRPPAPEIFDDVPRGNGDTVAQPAGESNGEANQSVG